MATFVVIIDTSNSTFGDDGIPELCRCLHSVVIKVKQEETKGVIEDCRKNEVGMFRTFP